MDGSEEVPPLWPALSPDTTLVDFRMWGQIKSQVYETPVASEKDLVARITIFYYNFFL